MRFVILCGLGLCALTVLAQESPTIRVNTQLVDVEVVVRGSDGPIDNLTVDDFRLYDKGKQQRIAFFSIHRQTAEPVLRPLGEGTHTNRVYRPDGQPVAPTVILLDTLNSLPHEMSELRRQLGIYLNEQGLREPIAIYHLNSTLTVLQDFTGDLDRVKKIVAGWAAPASINMNWEEMLLGGLPTSGDEITVGMAEAAAKEGVDMANLRRADNTAFALVKIAEHLKGIPGRKRLIWAGGSFPAITSEQRSRLGSKQIEVRYYNGHIEKAVRALNEAHVAVYPIDPRRPSPFNGNAMLNPGIDTMNLIASGTGGKARYATVDLTGAVRQAMEDSLITYRLGFYTQDGALDGKYHNIDVKVARSGAEVRHRQGYLAAQSKPPSAKELAAILRTALESPLDVTGLGLSAAPLEVPAGERPQFLLRLEARDLALQNEGNAWVAQVTLATSYPKDVKLPGAINELKLTFTEDRLRQVLAEGYLVRLLVEQDPKSRVFRVAVLDQSTGRAGTLTVTLPK